MQKYIDTDMYIKYCDEHWIPLNVDAVKAQPTADVVEVVRCKDCLLHGVCRFEQGLGLNGFCSQGQRRDT